MDVSIKFDPAVDALALVIRTVNAAYGTCENSLEYVVGDARVTANGTHAIDQMVSREPQHPSGFNADELNEADDIANHNASQAPGAAAAAFSGHSNVGAAANFANGTESNGQHFSPSPEAGNAALAAGLQQDQAAGAVSIELDKNGLPWDKRIHSDAAERLTQAGVWKKKRGAADDLVAKVEAELRAALAAGGGAPAPGLATIPAGGMLGGQNPDQQMSPATGAAVNQAQQQQQQQPGVQVDSPINLAQFMAYAMPQIKNPMAPNAPLVMGHMNEIAYRLNLIDPATGKGEIRMLDANPTLVPQAVQWLDWFVANPTAPFLGPV